VVRARLTPVVFVHWLVVDSKPKPTRGK